MRSLARWGVAIVAAVGVLGTAGCGSASVEGQAETTKPEAGEPAFDPCSIPDDAVRAAGMDPTSESREIFDVKQPGWSLCNWNGANQMITIFATARSLDEIQANERFVDFTPVDLGDRSAFTFREVSDTDNQYCDVVFNAGTDTVMIKSGYFTNQTPPEGPCPLAIRNAQIFEPTIPR